MFAELDPSTLMYSLNLFLQSLVVPAGAIKRVLCCYWPPERARRVRPCVITWSGNTKFVMCGQCQRWSYKKRLKKVKTKKNLKDCCLVSPTGNKWRCVTRSQQRRQQYGTDAIHFCLELFRQ